MRVRALAALLVAPALASCGHAKRSVRLPSSGSLAVVLDRDGRRPLAAVRFNNRVLAAVADGSGGWYVGGSFIHANGHLRKRLAHIRRDGTLDPHWHPSANGTGVSVNALALADGRLYVAGDFARVNGRPRIHFAVLDAKTGRLEPGQPRQTVGGIGVLTRSDGEVIAGGIGGLAQLFSLDRWALQLGTFLEGGGVRQLAAVGGRLYIAGMFETVHGVRRSGLAALDARTGRLDRRWTPPRFGVRYCPSCTSVEALAATQRRVYLSFGRELPPHPPLFEPRSFSQLLALDATTGALDRGWSAATPATPPYGSSVLVLRVAGERLYVGGTFRALNGHARHGFAALDARTARLLDSWSPTANSSTVNVISPSRDRLLLGIDLSPEVAFSVDRVPYGRVVDSRRYQSMTGIVSVSAAGTVIAELGRLPAGRSCTTDARCPGRTLRRVRVTYPTAATKRVALSLRGLPRGRYFVRFTVRGRGAPSPERPVAYPFRIVP